MASLRLPHFRIDPSRPPHEPSEGEDPTQAATSLRSGTFQYVDSDFLSKASSVLTHVSASAIDSSTGRAYFLRRVRPQLIVLDPSGKDIISATDPDLKTGHSIKLIDAGKGLQPWVADEGSSTIRVYDVDGKFVFKIGPEIPGSGASAKGESVEGTGTGQSVRLGKVTDVAFDVSIRQFYITDGDAGGPYNRVVVLNSFYQCIAVWGGGSGPAIKNQFPKVDLYGISISTARAVDKNHAMVYLTGNTPGHPSDTGTIILLTTRHNPKNPSDIGSNIPLTVWDKRPGTMLHWICSGHINGKETILLSNLPNSTGPAVNEPPSAFAYQLAVPRPLFQEPTPSRRPLWPENFHAVALLHPFEKDNQSFCVAEIWYAESTCMRFDMYTPTGIGVSFLYKSKDGNTHFQISINGGQYSRPIPTSRVIPEHNWIARMAHYQGQLPILDVQTNWWYTVATKKTTMWHWFRDDTNAPWRTMNSIDSNPDNIPVLQDFAFINWPTFTPGRHRDLQNEDLTGVDDLPQSASLTSFHFDGSVAQILGTLVLLDKAGLLGTTDKQRKANLAKFSQLVPGLSPGSDGLPIPRWPSRFFMTCTMTAINDPSPMSTEVLYDWPSRLQRTRMFNWNQASCVDAVLTTVLPQSPNLQHVPGTTYIIWRNADGKFKCGKPIQGIGPPPPDWAAQDNAEIVATIKNNPQLSPNATTRIFRCPFDTTSQSQFWIWYSDRYATDTPVVFMQTLPPPSVGTNLALADYWRMQTTPLVDPVSFNVPQKCRENANNLTAQTEVDA
ncbi:hypothetical protein DL765_001248 [Monosporascus sp. GIB2]|nr:hypothetical protein DL765_001248 [Monosporascus sp. GIB2]